MERYEIRLQGAEARGNRISGPLLLDLLSILTEGSRQALRLRLDGRSKFTGPAPSWLAPATRFDVVGIRDGSTIVDIEAPSLAEAAPEKFAQRDFFSEMNIDQSAVTLMEASLSDALSGKAESDLYDDDLIETFEGLSEIVGKGYDTLQMKGPRPVSVDAASLRKLVTLRDSTPAPRRVRIAGFLEAIRWSDRMFTLKLADGSKLRGVALSDAVDRESLRLGFGTKVAISARAVFRPSGRVLRIEADHMEAATGDVGVWSVVPKPMDGKLDRRTLIELQGPKTGINAIWGKWPGDESDEQIAEWLRNVS